MQKRAMIAMIAIDTRIFIFLNSFHLNTPTMFHRVPHREHGGRVSQWDKGAVRLPSLIIIVNYMAFPIGIFTIGCNKLLVIGSALKK